MEAENQFYPVQAVSEKKYLDYYLFTLFRRLKLAKLYSPSSQAFGHYFFHPAPTSSTSSPDVYDNIIQCAERLQLVPVDDASDGKQEIKQFLASKEVDFAIQCAFYQLFKFDLKTLALASSIALLLAIPVIRELLVSTAVLTGVVFGIAYLGWLIMENRQELKKECYIPEIQKILSFDMS